MITRRQAVKTAGLAVAACSALPLSMSAQPQATPASSPFTVPPLPYAFDALEPFIDARTMEIHHDKHHAAYVANLNKAMVDAPAALTGKTVEELVRDLNSVPEKIRTAVRNQGGGHYNHTLFWQMMSKGSKGEPSGELASAMDKAFGSFSSFKDKFTEAATKVFGSGWAWLVVDGQKLSIESTPNQDSPIMNAPDKKVLLGIDVWEHAYYLKYQNRRPEYIAAWLKVADWDFAARRFAGK